MTTRQWRTLYERTAPALALFCLLASLFASVGVFYNDHENGQQDRARIAGQAELLACFDRYSQASSATSQAVRDSSVTVADAQTKRDQALQAIFAYIATSPADDDPRGLKLFSVLLSANSDLVTAQAALAEVRSENPVPDPPSEFCSKETK